MKKTAQQLIDLNWITRELRRGLRGKLGERIAGNMRPGGPRSPGGRLKADARRDGYDQPRIDAAEARRAARRARNIRNAR